MLWYDDLSGCFGPHSCARIMMSIGSVYIYIWPLDCVKACVSVSLYLAAVMLRSAHLA